MKLDNSEIQDVVLDLWVEEADSDIAAACCSGSASTAGTFGSGGTACTSVSSAGSAASGGSASTRC